MQKLQAEIIRWYGDDASASRVTAVLRNHSLILSLKQAFCVCV